MRIPSEDLGPSYIPGKVWIALLRRLPHGPDQAMDDLWQRARVVHDVAAIQEAGVVAELLAGEPGRNGDDGRPRRKRPADPRRGVLDSQALPRLNPQLPR